MVELCLLGIGISLVIYSIMGLKKEGKNFDNILNVEVDNFKTENLQLGIIRTEIAESIFDLQKEIEELREEIFNFTNKDTESSEDKKNSKKIIKDNKRDVDELLDYDYNNNKDNRLYIQELVKEQLNHGKSIEDISSELGIGRGEILLIQNLKL